MIYRLIELEDELSNNPLNSMRAMHLDERIAAYLLDGDDADSRLDSVISRLPRKGWSDLYLDPDRLNRLRDLCDWWRGQPLDKRAPWCTFTTVWQRTSESCQRILRDRRRSFAGSQYTVRTRANLDWRTLVSCVTGKPPCEARHFLGRL